MSSDHDFDDIVNLGLTYSKGIMGVIKGLQNGGIGERKKGAWSSWNRIRTSAEGLSMANRRTRKPKKLTAAETIRDPISGWKKI